MGMDPGSQGAQGCPSPGMAERGEGSGGCNRGDGLPPGTGNGGCNRSDGLPPVPGTPSQQVVDGGTPMRHRKTACFEALVLEPHFAQSCARFLLLYCILGWQSSLQASFHWKTQNVKLPVCPTPAGCICSNSGAIFSAGQ